MFIPGTEEKLNLKNFVLIISLGIIYFLAGKLGLSLAVLHPSATPIWVPTGIAIASFFILGPKIWPGIFLGAFFVNLTVQGAILTSLVISLGNTLEGIIGAYLINNFTGKYETFYKTANVLKYILLVGVIASSISATVGVTSLFVGGFVDAKVYSSVWLTWMLGDMGGALIVAPLIILWSLENIVWTLPKAFEAALAFILITSTNILLFSGSLPSVFNSIPTFFSLPILIWVALRFGPKAVSTFLFAIFIIAAYGTLNGLGPFVSLGINQSLLAIQLLLGVVFLSVMSLAAAIYHQRKVEDALRERKEEYEKLVETSPDAILVSDLNGNIKNVNTQTLKMLRLKRKSEILGKNIFDFVVPEEQEKTRKLLADLLKKGPVENIEYFSVRKDGTKFYSSSNASLLFDTDGKPEGIVIVSHDITKKKKLESMKSEFVSIASHQLRTPLGSMRWSMEMLINGDYGKIPAHIKNIIEDLYESLLRLIRLVNDLLDVSRIEEERFFDIPQQVEVVKLIKNVIKNMSAFTRKRNLKISLHIHKSKIDSILIGKEKLTDVFENLLSNSIKYTKPGGKIDVWVQKNNNKIVVKFKDTGIGIPKRDKKKIFSKFYRSSRTTEIDTEGTGLGLFIVKSYMVDWGGKIYFKSKVGIGSEFTVEIPTNPILKGANFKNEK